MLYISQVLTVGALHQVDSAALRTAASVWHDEFAPLPKPLLVVNIGGPTSNLFTAIILLLDVTFYLFIAIFFYIHFYFVFFAYITVIWGDWLRWCFILSAIVIRGWIKVTRYNVIVVTVS